VAECASTGFSHRDRGTDFQPHDDLLPVSLIEHGGAAREGDSPHPLRGFAKKSLRPPCRICNGGMSHLDSRVYEPTRLEPLLTVDEVAAVLGISRKTVYRLVGKELQPVRVEQRLRFEPADVRAYLERHRQSPQGGDAVGGPQAA
jgi:excisionase family DNA binding protein